MKTGCRAYQKINTLSMSQLDLVLTVYKGAVDFLNQAKSDYMAEKFTDGRDATEKARKCVVHLYTTLDMEKGKEISQNLGRLYAFCIEQIDLVTGSKSMERIDSIINVLETLKEGWEALKAQQKAPVSKPPDEEETADPSMMPTNAGRGITVTV